MKTEEDAEEYLLELMVRAAQGNRRIRRTSKEIAEEKLHSEAGGRLIEHRDEENAVILWSEGSLIYVDWRDITMPVGRRFVSMKHDDLGYYFVGEYYRELVDEDGGDVWSTFCDGCGTNLLGEDKIYRKLHNEDGERIIDKKDEESFCESCRRKERVKDAI